MKEELTVAGMADQALGRRASDQMAVKNATDIAVMEARLKAQEDETARNRSFRHETNNTLQKLVTNTENMADDIKALLSLSGRVSGTEQDQATHTAICDQRYKSIEDYMEESKADRAGINKKINEGSNRVLLGLLVACVSIITAFLWRFGLPPMN